jgi:CarD family transcriptional regulator
MQLAIGDTVVYPGRGIGEIIDIQRLDLVEGFERYYVVEIRDKRLTVSVPMRKIEELGVRPAMSRAKLVSVLETLGSSPQPLPANYKQRQDQVREELETGRPLRIAAAMRDLTWRQHEAYLTKVDSDLLVQARDALTAEIASITGTQLAAARQQIEDALAAGMA